ncbi:MAG TPA: CPBP family intramembrane glutamic endopeptidase [Terracidiphilus sp.]|jgi:hypothetical protein|nr:CPBP family intramembrane glutamic endopeptidase [Terracidiphilus sp.]
MEPENPTPVPEVPGDRDVGLKWGDTVRASRIAGPDSSDRGDFLLWAFIGPQGLRCGWSAGLFIAAFKILLPVAGTLAMILVPWLFRDRTSPMGMLVGETIPLAAVVAAGFLLALVEGRRIREYNLVGPRRVRHSLAGALTGFGAVSALLGLLELGGWVRVTPGAEGMRAILASGAVWAAVFLMVGLVEEGSFRCFLFASLTRGVNFWWAVAAEAGICAYAVFSANHVTALGVFLFALAGILPCAWLAWRRNSQAGLWQAAWVTSTLFGAIHTGNRGENWIGIFAAAGIGFVFCVSVKVTGSVWWAIGCHAAWDWAETYFYGTPDSGMIAKGHLMTATSSGPAIWSGGLDGPEGSLLVIPIMLLILLVLVVQYGRRRQAEAPGAMMHQAAG